MATLEPCSAMASHFFMCSCGCVCVIPFFWGVFWYVAAQELEYIERFSRSAEVNSYIDPLRFCEIFYCLRIIVTGHGRAGCSTHTSFDDRDQLGAARARDVEHHSS